MPVSYTREVSYSRLFRFLRLLFRWRGSFYKHVTYQVLIFATIYTVVNVLKTFIMTEKQLETYRKLGSSVGALAGYISAPVTFCLGFFLLQIYKRFWRIFLEIPWVDGVAFLVSSNVLGRDEFGKKLRKTIVRLVCASIVNALLLVSPVMAKRFPNPNALIKPGFITEDEARILQKIDRRARWMTCLTWSGMLVNRARNRWGRIEDEQAYSQLVDQLDVIRNRCRRQVQIHNRPVPFVYFQTVLLAVYAFFVVIIISGAYHRQSRALHSRVVKTSTTAELWGIHILIELVSILHFSLFAGMLCAARALVSPFNNDDNNFESHMLIQRHLEISYLIVDDLYDTIPFVLDMDGGSIYTADNIFVISNCYPGVYEASDDYVPALDDTDDKYNDKYESETIIS